MLLSKKCCLFKKGVLARMFTSIPAGSGNKKSAAVSILESDLQFIDKVNACVSFNRRSSAEALNGFLQQVYTDRNKHPPGNKTAVTIENLKKDFFTLPTTLRNSFSFSTDDGLFLYNLVRSVKPKKVLELGSYYGKTTNLILSAMNPEQYAQKPISSIPRFDLTSNSCKVYSLHESDFFSESLLLSCDVKLECVKFNHHYMSHFRPPSILTRAIRHSAHNLLDELPNLAEFDLILFDCDKMKYKQCYEKIIAQRLLSKSGLLLFANCLNRGSVSTLDEPPSNKLGKFALSKHYSLSLKLNKLCFHIAEDPKSVSTMVPFCGGLVAVQPLYQ
ncbi:hypothetical protein DSO57_1023413 [Entomophthora muscae]|uniref:Uncharacterized protein n=2 Tax=Entomophthora muscae TaxID=34485 RepID=A0ACC2SS35_9FUNG|nr:hypothetical protein DSO57_1023413 [Entomophthora muscae]